MKAIMKYPGSKWSIAEWIISFFPEHHSFVEVFFGSGAVLFNKDRSNIETVNDLDGNVVNLFEWIKKDPERLAREIYYTPYARQIYDNAFAVVPEDSFGKAVNFYIRLNIGHGSRTNGEKVGWKNDVQGRERMYALWNWYRLPDWIIEIVERLQDISPNDAHEEGITFRPFNSNFKNYKEWLIKDFCELWNSTIKKADIDRYGWNTNPWVWVIEFEQCEKPEKKIDEH